MQRGVLYLEGAGPEGYLLPRAGVPVVALVPPKGIPRAGKLHPYLMMPAGMEADTHQSPALSVREGGVGKPGGLCAAGVFRHKGAGTGSLVL